MPIKNILTFLFVFFLALQISAQLTVQTFTSSSNFTVPSNVTAIKVEAWGGGGGGGNRSSNGAAGGGGGGAYAAGIVTVISNNSYPYVVGTGGGSSTNGTNSSFNTNSVIAEGGNGGTSNGNAGGNGGRVQGGTSPTIGNITTRAGGNGGTGINGTYSGSGGGAAGIINNGGNGSASNTGGGAGTGYPFAPTNSGIGGAGINSQGTGNQGNLYGAGGSGGYRTSFQDRLGGGGRNGVIRITYLSDPIIGNTDLAVGGTTSLFYTIPGTWSSGNTGVATVNPTTGTITGIAVGYAVITFTSTEGLQRTITVNVGNPIVEVHNFSESFTVPVGVNSIKVEAWGGGGRGAGRTAGNYGFGGGGGGAYAASILTVTSGSSYNYVVGTGGNGGTANGTNSTFNTNSVIAAGGTGAANNSRSGANGGTIASSTGTIRMAGGNGGTAVNTSGTSSGSGGGAAGITDNGGNGSASATGGAAGTGYPFAPTNPGIGGAGRNTNGNGNQGNLYGSGGGGAYRTSGSPTGGAGANGVIRISYLPPITGTSAFQLNQSATLSNAVSGGIWTSSDPGIASIDPNTGVLTAGNTPGTAVITYTVGTSPNHLTQTYSILVKSNAIPDLDADNDGIPDCEERRLDADIDKAFALNGKATKMGNYEARLTEAVNNEQGQMWSYGKVDFTKDFTIDFEAKLSATINDGGADGIAIVFQNDPAGINAVTTTPQNGSAIGAYGIQNGIVLEIDTYTNGAPINDPDEDHIHIWRSVDQTSLIAPATFNANIENNTWYPVTVTWTASTGTMTFSVTGAGNPSLTYINTNIINDIFGGASKVHFGYTSSTGGANNEHRVRFPNGLCNLPLGVDTDNDGIFDYLDLDSDNDGCPDALEGSGNILPGQLVLSGPNAGSIAGPVDGNGIPLAANGGQTGGSAYNDSINTCPDYCVKPGLAGTGTPTKLGITTQTKRDGWPESIPNGFITLESSNKGLVITRVANENAILLADRREGMLIYDNADGCVKLYNGSVWKCIERSCNE